MWRPPRLTAHQKRDALKALADGTATQADSARMSGIAAIRCAKPFCLPNLTPCFETPIDR